MDGVQVVRKAFDGSHMWYQGTIEGVTAEQANQIPPGVVHPIGELVAHILHCEDAMINMAIRGKSTVWERDGWATKFGVPVVLDMTPETRNLKCDPQAWQSYALSVYQSTSEYLDTLKPEDLSKEIDLTPMGMGKMALSEFLVGMLLGNNYAHTGEISALKGMLGAKGYPF